MPSSLKKEYKPKFEMSHFTYELFANVLLTIKVLGLYQTLIKPSFFEIYVCICVSEH